MKKHTLGLSIATILLLAACGGGGSDDSSPADLSKNALSNKTPAPPTNQIRGPYEGKLYIIPANGEQGRAKNIANYFPFDLTFNDGSDINSERKSFTTSSRPGDGMTNQNSEYTDSYGKTISYKAFLVSNSAYTNSTFGYINDYKKNYIFSQGKRTTNMPITGVVRYKGDAAVGNITNIDIANADFTADFGQKNLHGQITQKDKSSVYFSPINISANINGNTFDTGEKSVTSYGYFYGTDAAEVGGIFHDSEQSIYGSFGARRNRN